MVEGKPNNSNAIWQFTESLKDRKFDEAVQADLDRSLPTDMLKDMRVSKVRPKNLLTSILEIFTKSKAA